MSTSKKLGLFYKDCNLYIGEYILSDITKNNDTSENKNKDFILKKTKEDELNDTKNKSKIKNEDTNKINELNNIILDGEGKYIKKNEMFVGKFKNNHYRKGIWIKYKNIHNLFFYMNINEILKKTELKELDNFKNILYLPLKETYIYNGEFENNMFNGFSLYYFYPYLYIGYFINNCMNGYGYIFHFPSINKNNFSINEFMCFNNLFNFLFKNVNNEKTIKKKKETEITRNIKEKEYNFNETNKNILNDEILRNVYENLKIMMKRKYEKKEKIDTENNKNDRNFNLINKIENEIYNNFEFKVKKKKKIKQLKDFLKKNECANFFDIFNYINYSNLIFKGYFYNNKFSNLLNDQLFYKNKFIHMYKNLVIQKIENIKNEIINSKINTNPMNIQSNELIKNLFICENNEFYLIEKNKKHNSTKKKNDTKKNLKDKKDIKKINTNISFHDLNENELEEIKFKCLNNIIDISILKTFLDLTTKNSIQYNIKVITDEKLWKYKNKLNQLKTKNNKINEATINLNGYHQLVIINIKSNNEINIHTNKGNFQNVNKIKIFLISSNESSIINYNTFILYYIFIYVKILDKKIKNKTIKKK